MELKAALECLRDMSLKDMDEEEHSDAVSAVQAAIGDLEVDLYNARARIEELEPFLAVVPCANPSEHEAVRDVDELHDEVEKLRLERNELRIVLAAVRGAIGRIDRTVTSALAKGVVS